MALFLLQASPSTPSAIFMEPPPTKSAAAEPSSSSPPPHPADGPSVPSTLSALMASMAPTHGASSLLMPRVTSMARRSQAATVRISTAITAAPSSNSRLRPADATPRASSTISRAETTDRSPPLESRSIPPEISTDHYLEGGFFSGIRASVSSSNYRPRSSGTWTPNVLYTFAGTTDGSGPRGSVILDAAGNLYGTTASGGAGTCGYGCGVAFKLTPTASGPWNETVLYSFLSNGDGAFPLLGSNLRCRRQLVRNRLGWW